MLLYAQFFTHIGPSKEHRVPESGKRGFCGQKEAAWVIILPSEDSRTLLGNVSMPLE